jgi:hypothetical protein
VGAACCALTLVRSCVPPTATARRVSARHSDKSHTPFSPPRTSSAFDRLTAAAGLAEASTSTSPGARAYLLTRTSLSAAVRLLPETADPWGEGECQRLSSFALLNASSTRAGARALLCSGALSPLTVMFDETPRARLDAAARLYTAGTLANLITAGGARAASIFRGAGGVPTLLFLLRRATGREGFLVNALRRFPAALAAAYVEFEKSAAGDLVAGGAVDALVDALHTASAGGDGATLVEAVGAIAALAGAPSEGGNGAETDSVSDDRTFVQLALVHSGAVGACVVAAATPILGAALRATLALALMAAHADAKRRKEISEGALETLAVLAASDDALVCTRAMRALVYLAVEEEAALALDTADVGHAIAGALIFNSAVVTDGTASSTRKDDENALQDTPQIAALDLAAAISSHARARARGGVLETLTAGRLAAMLLRGLHLSAAEENVSSHAFAAAALTLSNWVADAAGRRAVAAPSGGHALEALASVACAPSAPTYARRHALTALANCAGAGRAAMKLAAASGALQSALVGATIPDGQARAAAARILRGLVLGSPRHCEAVVSSGATATVIMLVGDVNAEARAHAIAALQALCATSRGAEAAASEGAPQALARVAEAALRAGAGRSAPEGSRIALTMANLTAEPLALEACAANPRMIECLLGMVSGILGPRAARAAATALSNLAALSSARSRILTGVVDSLGHTDSSGSEFGYSLAMDHSGCGAHGLSAERPRKFVGSAVSDVSIRPTINLDLIREGGDSGVHGARRFEVGTALRYTSVEPNGSDAPNTFLQSQSRRREVLFGDAIAPAPEPAPGRPRIGAEILVTASTSLDSSPSLASEAMRCLTNCASVDCAIGANALWFARAPQAAINMLDDRTPLGMRRLASALLANAALSSFACAVRASSNVSEADLTLHKRDLGLKNSTYSPPPPPPHTQL